MRSDTACVREIRPVALGTAGTSAPAQGKSFPESYKIHSTGTTDRLRQVIQSAASTSRPQGAFMNHIEIGGAYLLQPLSHVRAIRATASAFPPRAPITSRTFEKVV